MKHTLHIIGTLVGAVALFFAVATPSAGASPPAAESGGVALADVTASAASTTALYALPPQEKIDSMKVGDSVTIHRIASIRGSGGLRIDNLSLLKPFISRQGIVNFETITSTGAVYNFSAHISENRSGVPSSLVSVNAGAASPAPVDIGSIPSADRIALPRSAASSGASGVTPDGCSVKLTDIYENVPVLVGEYYSQYTTIASMYFRFDTGTSSSLGIGFSVSGDYGSYSADGTSSSSWTASQQFKTADQSQHLWAPFDYGKYLYSCVYPGGDSYFYNVRSRGYDGGGTAQNVGLPANSKYRCESESGTFSKTSTHAIKWTNGISISDHIGINLSSDSGYSTTTYVHFQFHKRAQICGTNGAPAQSPGELGAMW